jgi:hypothetical protein
VEEQENSSSSLARFNVQFELCANIKIIENVMSIPSKFQRKKIKIDLTYTRLTISHWSKSKFRDGGGEQLFSAPTPGSLGRDISRRSWISSEIHSKFFRVSE